MVKEKVNTKTGEIVEVQSSEVPELFEEFRNDGFRISQDTARQINSLDDWEKFVGRDLVDFDEVMPSFQILNKENKETLCGIELLLLDWRFNLSKKIIKNGHQAEFVSVLCLNMDSGEKVIINDGSTGIYQQLKAVTNLKGIQGGLLVRGGLRKSEYPYETPDGSIVEATTYYLASN